MQFAKAKNLIWLHLRLKINRSLQFNSVKFFSEASFVHCFKNSGSFSHLSPGMRNPSYFSLRFICTEKELKTAKLKAKHAATEAQAKLVVVTLSDGQDCKFPWLWLRDNCQCAACFNSSSYSRIINWESFDTKVFPVDVSIGEDAVRVAWSDGHESVFSLAWLLERRFTAAAQEEWLTKTYQPSKVSWGSEQFPLILRRFCYKDVIESCFRSDECLLEWLESLAVHGVAFLERTPHRTDQVRQLADRVAFIKKTVYGEEFHLKVQPDATNVAYLATPLQMHIDLPYYQYKPGSPSTAWCKQPAGGAVNQLTDGLRVVEHLRASHPGAYDVLAATPVEWADVARDGAREWFLVHRAPVIREDCVGQFASINYSQQQRDSHFSVPLESVNKWYEACATLTQVIHHPDNTVFLKIKPGEILTFDNFRLLHGRSGYDNTPGQERHLVGAYLDWDHAYSCIRVLRRDGSSRGDS
ncbi:gamma-butyrobetaine dioxygenase-like [Bacillus rossius redtenbacheri]|uniref:gamma-butyrobetaine dioxygenase-like n=1 Tax=Bacillus rossius redtenbacheri TaxID=93214 RepID=UPI002FDEEAE6